MSSGHVKAEKCLCFNKMLICTTSYLSINLGCNKILSRRQRIRRQRYDHKLEVVDADEDDISASDTTRRLLDLLGHSLHSQHPRSQHGLGSGIRLTLVHLEVSYQSGPIKC